MLRVIATVAMLLVSAASQASLCPTPVAPDIAAVGRIAKAAIDAAPAKDVRHYELVVEPDRDRPGHWIAYQMSSDGVLGGGMSMRIDRCSGKVSALYRQR